MTLIDDHGQPLDLRINARRRADRTVNEMLGVCKGMLADGNVTNGEVYALADWFTANPDAISTWPGLILATRLRKILADGRIDEDERTSLTDLMRATIGTIDVYDANPTTDLPLDDPPPPLVFVGRTFLFTGAFVYGTRRECQQAVVARGGQFVEKAVQRVNVLVIGCIGSRDWIHSSFGRKIEAVMHLKRQGFPIVTVDEHHWTSQLLG